ncbi:MAG: AraC family transcriptional regulator [Corynebacterium sp.]|nr:AraC family transcriptional regulator [Corynebacterium sp.]
MVNAPEKVFSVLAGDLVIAPQGAFVSGTGVVIPMYFPDLSFQGQARRIHIGTQWNDYMLYEFARSLMGERLPSATVGKLFCDRAATPAMPQGDAARVVAQQLSNNPADQTALIDFAKQTGVSSRTLQRQFLSSTGYTFSEWRAAYRVSVAAGLLSHDFTIAVVANLVGFHATSSLTRAFRRHTGTTPSAFTTGAVGMGRAGNAPEIPASTTFARAEEDLALWIYRGTATVTTTGYCRFMGAGEIVTIPANTSTRLDVAAGSIALPIPVAQARDNLTLEDVLQISLHQADIPDVVPLGATEKRQAERELVPTV